MNDIKSQAQLINDRLLKFKTKKNDLFNSTSSLNYLNNNQPIVKITKGKRNKINNTLNKKLFNNLNSFDSNFKSQSFKNVGYKDNESTKTSDKNLITNITEREKSNNSEKKKSLNKFKSNNFNTTSYAKKTTPKIDYSKHQTIKVNRNNFLQKIRQKTEANLLQKKINGIDNEQLNELRKNISN